MTPPKHKKPSTPWFECEKCQTNVLHKDIDQHTNNCPPSLTGISHHFVRNGMLFGTLDIKTVEDIKGISPHDRDNLVFLSQSVIQLCGLAIGENAVVYDLEKKFAKCARIVWPTAEKTLVAVLLTKNGLETSFEKKDLNVCVSKITTPTREAQQITLTALTNLRNLELSSELQNRIHKSHLHRLLTERNKLVILFYGKVLKFEVKLIQPLNSSLNDAQLNRNLEDEFDGLSINDKTVFYKVTEKTKFCVFRNETEYLKETNIANHIDKIGGLNAEISEIRDLMNLALGKTRTISRSTICKGILLYGSSGTGKTLVANSLCKESGVNLVNINMNTLYNKSGDTEEIVTKLFEDAIKHAPSIIFIDEIDMFCPSRSSRVNDSEKRVMSNLLYLFNYINETADSELFVIATSNKPDSIDSAFRRCGRLDREIEIPTPNPKGRFDILNKLLLNVPHDINEDQLREVTNSSHGFVGSDLVSLCSRAALHGTKRGDSKINFGDLKFALTRVRPSAMREVQIEVPDVKWTDIGGQNNLKLILRQAVEWPLKHPECFIRMGITPPRGVLMFGPPGCSKTMIAKALATESGLNFLSIKGPELFSKWVGESERAVRDVFRKARQVAPSIIFFDEIDALGGERSSGSSTSVQERVLAQLLTELDGVTPLGDVTVLAATNRPDRIDKALLRPGRLDRIVYVPLPDDNTRREIFNLKLSKMPITDGIELENLVGLTEGYSGAEVNAVCHEAAMKALEESLESQTVEMRHFEKALNMITPRTPPSLLKIYEDYLKQ